jgi:3-oxoacyl-[acyl-carrier protein] reductase
VSTPLDGRVAIVTGGTGGIGTAVCAAFARAGAQVVAVARSADRVEVAGAALALALDVGDEDDMAEMAAVVEERFGRIDVLVTCAGVDVRVSSGRAVPDPVTTMAEKDWDAVIRTNLRGTFLAVRAVLPAMRRRHRGDVLTVSSSPGGLRGQPLAAAYCASKFAVNALSEALAEEVRRDGIRVQVLVPGLVDTGLVESSTLAARHGQPLPPARVGELAVTLAALPDDVTIPPSRRYGLPVLRHARASAS